MFGSLIKARVEEMLIIDADFGKMSEKDFT